MKVVKVILEFLKKILSRHPVLEVEGRTKKDAIDNVETHTESHGENNTLLLCTTESQVEWWVDYYQSRFGINVEITEDMIPERPEGDWRLIVVAEGISMDRVYKQCASIFKIWSYSSRPLDKDIDRDDRDPLRDGTYVIWVPNISEADDTVDINSIEGVTVRERLLDELQEFEKHGTNLDIYNVTLCTGSHHDYGGIASVFFERTCVGVTLHSCGRKSGPLGTRRVISKNSLGIRPEHEKTTIISREEYLESAKKQAIKVAESGDITNAYATFLADLSKNSELNGGKEFMLVGMMAVSGLKQTKEEVIEFINGFK